ncbi:hypothetical protein A2296_02610 [candidate division CPR3 bacterium RIFOXYB2_FULL_35_8]|nr:MAG: hypothetical protein A2250_00030 [candidate division CPR3 bacterium RIFOXYA2_FULL_35_13]OGB79057.1 MAG: hypothetical protein A2296_02610 [candidate division CPR3 bacterium RIFOXYB2_FULL_35_8]
MKKVLLSLTIIASVMTSLIYTGYYLSKNQMVISEGIVEGVENTSSAELKENTESTPSVNIDLPIETETEKIIIPKVTKEPIKIETSSSATKETTPVGAGTVIHIDSTHANIGRLFNLRQVEKSLNGKVIKPGEKITYNTLIELSMSSLKYMYGEAFTSTGYAPAGGVCGGSSALAGEVDRVEKGLTRKDDGGRHPAYYHQPGGLYYNLPNVAVFFDGTKHTDIYVINNNKTTSFKIKVVTNYENLWPKINIDLANWQKSGYRWNEYVDPKKYTTENEFQFKITLEPLK